MPQYKNTYVISVFPVVFANWVRFEGMNLLNTIYENLFISYMLESTVSPNLQCFLITLTFYKWPHHWCITLRKWNDVCFTGDKKKFSYCLFSRDIVEHSLSSTEKSIEIKVLEDLNLKITVHSSSKLIEPYKKAVTWEATNYLNYPHWNSDIHNKELMFPNTGCFQLLLESWQRHAHLLAK